MYTVVKSFSCPSKAFAVKTILERRLKIVFFRILTVCDMLMTYLVISKQVFVQYFIWRLNTSKQFIPDRCHSGCYRETTVHDNLIEWRLTDVVVSVFVRLLAATGTVIMHDMVKIRLSAHGSLLNVFILESFWHNVVMTLWSLRS